MKKIFFYLRIVITIVIFLYLFLFYIDFNNLIISIKKVNIMYLILTTFFAIFYRIISSYQTKIFLKPYGLDFSTYHVFKIQQISTFFGLLLPGDIAGGAITWHYYSRETGLRAQAAAVIIFLRIINLITIIPFALIGLYFEPRLINFGLENYIILLFLLSTILILPFFSIKCANIAELLLRKFFGIIPFHKIRTRFLDANINLWNSIRYCKDIPSKILINVTVQSIIIQIISVVSCFCLLTTVNIYLNFSVSLWMNAVLVIIAMLPISIMGIGVRDFSLIFLLTSLYNVEPENIVLFSTFTIVIGLIFPIIGGYYNIMMKKKS